MPPSDTPSPPDARQTDDHRYEPPLLSKRTRQQLNRQESLLKIRRYEYMKQSQDRSMCMLQIYFAHMCEPETRTFKRFKRYDNAIQELRQRQSTEYNLMTEPVHVDYFCLVCDDLTWALSSSVRCVSPSRRHGSANRRTSIPPKHGGSPHTQTPSVGCLVPKEHETSSPSSRVTQVQTVTGDGRTLDRNRCRRSRLPPRLSQPHSVLFVKPLLFPELILTSVTLVTLVFEQQ